MAKQSRKKSMRPKRRSFRKRTSKAYGKMVGGNFTQSENIELLRLGFTQEDIHLISDAGMGVNIIQNLLHSDSQIHTPDFVMEIVNEIIRERDEPNGEINESIISNVSNASDDENHDNNLSAFLHQLDDETHSNNTHDSASNDSNNLSAFLNNTLT